MTEQEQASLITVINQLHDLERKVQKMNDSRSLERNLRRMRAGLEGMGFSWHDPAGESYDETRTDCEASLVGDATGALVITETIKPLIRHNHEGFPKIIQRAVVVVGKK